MVLNGTQWCHRWRILFFWNVPDAILPKHLKHLLTEVRRGQVWLLTNMGKCETIFEINPGLGIRYDGTVVQNNQESRLDKEIRKRPFIDMVMWRRVQSHHPMDPPRSSWRYVGRFILPFHIMLRSAVWWFSGHSHGYCDRTLWWQGCNYGHATTLMT